MKRKVIQIGDSTQLVSLPRQWSIENHVKKGDELDVEVEGSKVIVETEKKIVPLNVSINISGLDRTSIMVLLRNLYKRGYDEITFIFDEQQCEHYRKKELVNVMSVILEETNRLIGNLTAFQR